MKKASAGKKEHAQRLMSDIVSSPKGRKSERQKGEYGGDSEEMRRQPESFWEKAEKESDSKKLFVEGDPPPPEKPRERKRRRWFGRKLYVTAAILFLLAAGSAWMAGAFFGKAEVSLNFKKTPWQYNGTAVASKTFSKIDSSKVYLPAEIFTQQKNVTRLFPASGNAQVSQKATAKILIYNAYSSSKQTLVATTRFATPDGKIFRLDSQVVVPGAGIKDGKIVPSSIEASITADKAGADYNVGPFDKLTIPGFKGTPRYDGFYGVMPTAAGGGFVGQKKVPTEQDIASAKDKTSQGLQDALKATFFASIPQGFRILEGAYQISVTKLSVNAATDDNGNFSVFGEAVLQAAGFRDEDMKSLATEMMEKDNPGMVFSDFKIDYQNAKADFSAGQVAFSASASGVLMNQFSEDDLRSAIAGKPVKEAESAVAELSGLNSGKISVWPFWLGKLPASGGKIKIVWN